MGLVKNMLSKHKLKAERRARFIGYIQQGMTAEAIGQREGMVREAVSELRRTIADEEGLTVSRVSQTKKSEPFGLTTESDKLRHGLRGRLEDFRSSNHMTNKEAAVVIGLTNAEYTRAIRQGSDGKPIHDWSLSQMQRLAAALNTPFDTFMRLVLDGPPNPLAGLKLK